MSLTVLDPGPYSLLVDAGRPRSRALGVPLGGAADRAAFALGNALVGNPPDAVALELTLAGPTLRADDRTAGVVFGANFSLAINGRVISAGTTFTLNAGDTLRIGGTPDGVRGYLCVPGGFDSPVILGSRSALDPLKTGDVLRCEPSAMRGRSLGFVRLPQGHPSPLRPGDPALLPPPGRGEGGGGGRLGLADTPHPHPPPQGGRGSDGSGNLLLPPPGRGEGGGGGRLGLADTPHPHPPPQGGRGSDGSGKLPCTLLRAVDGPQRDWFPADAFFDTPYTVTPAGNRMGVRLAGEPLARRAGELVSEAVAPGAVQVTNDGLPVVLGVDGQTIGGYPKVAHVVRADLDRLAQLRPGTVVRFRRASLEEAERAANEQAAVVHEWLTRLAVGY